jgi:quinol monooxygenase YgiN
MAVTGLIRRRINPFYGELLENILQELVALAVQQKGWLSAESMRRVDVSQEHLIICKREQIDSWQNGL